MESYITLTSDQLKITPEVQTLIEHLLSHTPDAMGKIIKSNHYEFTITSKFSYHNTEIPTFNIILDIPITNTLNELNKLTQTLSTTHPTTNLTGSYRTTSYNRTDKLTITKQHYYKCPGFDTAYTALKLLFLPNLTEKKFSKIDPQLTEKYDTHQGPNNYLYTKEIAQYDHRYHSLTIHIANPDIIPNIPIITEIMSLIANLW